MTIDDIDFGQLYRDHLSATSRTQRSASEWDARATKLQSKTERSCYAERFISRMDLSGADSLLDIGCGPGTICLPLAEKLGQVVGLDFSLEMLNVLSKTAVARGLNNVQTRHLAWEDDWSQVPECDVVVASRSTTVEDLADALAKLDCKARKRVYLTHLAGGRFIDPEVIRVVGRKLAPLPDYIYVVNILHGMGIQPRLDYIEHEGRFDTRNGFEYFVRQVGSSLGSLDSDELARLDAWYHRQSRTGSSIFSPMRWAFISWEKNAR